MNTNHDCTFCKIINGEIPVYKIYEDDRYIAFFDDVAQYARTHILLIPKQHYQFVWDSPDIASYYETAQKIAKSLFAKGYKYVDSITLGRGVPHAHLHIIGHDLSDPRWSKILNTLGEVRKNSDGRLHKNDLKALQKKLQID